MGIAYPQVMCLVCRSKRTGVDELGQCHERADAVASPSWKPLFHLLNEPTVAVGIAERDKRAVVATPRIRASDPSLGPGMMEDAAFVVKHVAHLDSTPNKLIPGCLDVGNDEHEPLGRARR